MTNDVGHISCVPSVRAAAKSNPFPLGNGVILGVNERLPGVTEGSSSTTAAGNVISTPMFTQWTKYPNCSVNEPCNKRRRFFFPLYLLRAFSSQFLRVAEGSTEIQQKSLKHLFAWIGNVAKFDLSWPTEFFKTLRCSIFMPNSNSPSEFAPNADRETNSPLDIYASRMGLGERGLAGCRDFHKRRNHHNP